MNSKVFLQNEIVGFIMEVKLHKIQVEEEVVAISSISRSKKCHVYDFMTAKNVVISLRWNKIYHQSTDLGP